MQKLNYSDINKDFWHNVKKYIFNLEKPIKIILRQNDIKCAAFTVAEVIMTLSIIGIIATLTIPSIISRNTTNANRIKIKKAMDVYSNTIITMVQENNLKANTEVVDKWAKENNCAKIRMYIKAIDEGSSPCQFKTADGLWWDVGVNGRVTKTIVAFKKENLTKEKAANEETYDAFFLMSQFDDKKRARIFDMQYSNYIGYSVNILNNAKVYA